MNGWRNFKSLKTMASTSTHTNYTMTLTSYDSLTVVGGTSRAFHVQMGINLRGFPRQLRRFNRT